MSPAVTANGYDVLSGLYFTEDYVGGNFVTVTAVPEPSTLVLAAFGTALAAWDARRRAPRQGMMQS